MTTFTDTNFTYAVLSVANKTLAIVGVNPTRYPTALANWGTFPPIPLTYAGTNTTYNGAGNAANAYKITEIGASAFESKTSFSNTTLTPTFLTSNLTRIGDKAFLAVKLVGTLTIPENVVNIGTMAFYNCTLLTNIVIGKVTNSDVVSHMSDLTAVLNQEILARKNADDVLHLLKAPVNNAVLTGITTIPTASIATASIATADIGSAVLETAVLHTATITTRLDVSGNAVFSDGSVTTTGQWDFTVQPTFNASVIATESFVNVKTAAIAGDGLSSTMNTLSDIATAIGNDPSLATTITTGNTMLLNSVASEISARTSAVTSLSTAVSATNASLLSVGSGLSTGLGTEISTRTLEVVSLSTAVSAASVSLSAVDSALSTGLSTEISARTLEVASLSTAVSASSASLNAVDSGLSTMISTETSTRTSAVASLSAAVSTNRSALVAADVSISTGISSESVARSQSVSVVSSTVSTAASSVSASTASLSAALTVETSARQTAVTSLSASVSGAVSVLRTTHLGVSSAFADESTALSSSVSSLSSGTSASASAITSANASLGSALTAEQSVQRNQISSLSVAASGALVSLVSANSTLGTVISTEVAVRDSQVQSVSSGVLSTALPSLTTAASNLTTSVNNETSAATSALSAAMSGLKGSAPAALDTLAEIASTLNTNPSLTQIASVMADVTAASNALSAEIVNRASAIVSVSAALSSSVVALSSADVSLSTVLSSEVSTRGSHFTSATASLSTTSSAITSVNNATAAALATETSVRAASVTSVGDAFATASASLAAADTALSTAISTELVARAVSLVTFSTSLSTATASLASVQSVMSASISAETDARATAITSVASVLSASVATMQTAITATTDSIAAVSSEAALKTTTAYLSTQISNLVGGAPPETLDTLAEIAAALNNQNNFAGSVTTALATKATVADVSALTDTLALKANQTDYTSLATVVSTKAAVTAASDASTSIAMINNNIVALVTELSALQANGSNVSPDTVAVNSISLTDLQNWTKEIYIKMGLTNANGTINERINRLKNPTLVSGTLAVAATTVTQLITVKFDKDQTSATVTGGVDNLTTTVNNMVLDASNNYTFSVVYAGSMAYYNTNKRDVSITALESQYSLAPLVPTVIASAPTSEIMLAANGMTIQYTGFASTVPTSTPKFIQANPRGTMEWFAVVTDSSKSQITSYAHSANSAVSPYFTPPGESSPVPFDNIVTTLMTFMYQMFETASSFDKYIGSWDTRNVKYMNYMFWGKTFNQNISFWDTGNVENMDEMFFGATQFNQPIASWNTSKVTTMNSMFRNATAFNQPISGWIVAQVTNYVNFRTNSGLTTGNTPLRFR